MAARGISIVIPAFNEEAFLPATLTSINLARQLFESETGLTSEVIVVNNASTDQTSQVAQTHGAVVIDHSLRNISSVRNAGIRQAKHQLIVTVDADCIIPHQGLVKIWFFMSDGRYIGGALSLRLITDSINKKIIAKIILTFTSLNSGMNGALFCFWKDDALSIGGFDESLLIAEDAAFSKALARHGKSKGKKFKLLKSVQVATVDRKDISLKSLLPLVWVTLKGLFGAKLDRKKLDFWYNPNR